MGYRKAGSKNSLASSLAVAAGLAAASYQMKTNPASYLGIYSALGRGHLTHLGGLISHSAIRKNVAFRAVVLAIHL